MAQVLIVEVDPGIEQSLRRITELRATRPELSLIAALKHADVALVRMLIKQGVVDVTSLPFDANELTSQILDQFARLEDQTADADLCPMLALAKSTGGCGTTTIATHLAAALAERGKNVCVVDFDLQHGDVASFVGENPSVTLKALLEAGARLDDDLLRSAITESRSGFSIIAAPSEIAPVDDLDIDQLLMLLRLVRRNYDFVLLDFPSEWTSWSLSIALTCADVLVVTDLSISGLRQAKRRIELLLSVGLRRDQIKIVVNRVERRLFKTIGLDDVAETLQCNVLAGIALEGQRLRSAQDQGELLFDIAGSSRFNNDIRALSGLIAGD